MTKYKGGESTEAVGSCKPQLKTDKNEVMNEMNWQKNVILWRNQIAVSYLSNSGKHNQRQNAALADKMNKNHISQWKIWMCLISQKRKSSAVKFCQMFWWIDTSMYLHIHSLLAVRQHTEVGCQYGYCDCCTCAVHILQLKWKFNAVEYLVNF